MKDDHVDNLLNQWENERPELDPESLGVIIRIQVLGKILRRRASRALAPLGLTLREYDVLTSLRRQGPPFLLSASELARESMLSTGAMTNRIDRLEQKGHVRRHADPSDRRGVLVGLTDAGRQLVNDAIGARLTTAEENLREFDPKERRELTGLLRRMIISL